MYLKYGDVITQRKPTEAGLQVAGFRQLEWFRPPSYVETVGDDTYGNFRGYYFVNRKLNLLDLGDWGTRMSIVRNTSLTFHDMCPDQQYSGGCANRVVHDAILGSCYFKRFDGTIISESKLDPEHHDDLDGVSEVVIFTERCGTTCLTLQRVDRVV